jgi:hypothetical protein
MEKTVLPICHQLIQILKKNHEDNGLGDEYGDDMVEGDDDNNSNRFPEITSLLLLWIIAT